MKTASASPTPNVPFIWWRPTMRRIHKPGRNLINNSFGIFIKNSYIWLFYDKLFPMKLASLLKTKHLLGFVLFLFITAYGFSQTPIQLKPGSTYKGISNNTYTSKLLRNGTPLNI